MADIILQKFFEIERWEKAIEKGVVKDIRKDQLIKLTSEETRIQMYRAMYNGTYEISPLIRQRYRRITAIFVQFM